MTVRELTQELMSLKEELQDKEVVVRAENGLTVRPSIKFTSHKEGNFRITKENVKAVVLDWED